MLMTPKKLTIAIPTYNRANYLDILLNSILIQYTNVSESLELVVSDNASTDNTKEVVDKYLSLGLQIKYFCQPENLGADRNIANCFMLGTSEFVWIVGDDDAIISNRIKHILALLDEAANINIIYLESKTMGKDNGINIINEISSIETTLFTNEIEFIRKTSFMLCYLSAIIVNKNILNDFKVSDKFFNTNLVQLSWIFTAICTSEPKNFIVITTPIVLYRPDNTSGWGYFTTVQNFLNIVYEQFSKSQIIKNIFENRILFYWVAGYLTIYKNNKPIKLAKEDNMQYIFDSTFRHNKYYKIFFKNYLSSSLFMSFLYEKIIWRGIRLINRVIKLPGF